MCEHLCTDNVLGAVKSTNSHENCSHHQEVHSYVVESSMNKIEHNKA